jgi:uncharacterized alkaline shock family protein YloU
MSIVMKNQLGLIEISDSVVAKIAGLAATDCMGVLGLASAESSWADLLRKDSVDRGVRVHQVEEGVLRVEVNIIAKYGVSIIAVAENVIDSVKYNVERMTGMQAQSVDVCVRSIRV